MRRARFHVSVPIWLSPFRTALQFTVYVDGLMLLAACTARLASLRYQPSTPTQPHSIILTTPRSMVFLLRPSVCLSSRHRDRNVFDQDGQPIGQNHRLALFLSFPFRHFCYSSLEDTGFLVRTSRFSGGSYNDDLTTVSLSLIVSWILNGFRKILWKILDVI